MSFENFDPSMSSFDPWGGQADAGMSKNNGQVVVTTGQLGSVTVSINNATANKLNVELFNYLNSITKVYNPALLAIQPFTFADVAKANTTSRVYFDASGNLIIEDAVGAKVTVSCKEVPYVTLFESSGVAPFLIQKIRLNVTNDAQISNDIIHTTKTFLGKVSTNSIPPRTYFNPNQFQSNIIDVPMNVEISAEKGLQYGVNAGEVVDLTMYLSAWRKFELTQG